MDYINLIKQAFQNLEVDLIPIFNCFDTGYDPITGWPLKLPEVDFRPNTRLILHFQDFVTPGQSIVELERVTQQYGEHANQVVVVHWSHGLDQHYTGPVKLVKFSNHNLATVQSIAQRESEWDLHFRQSRSVPWQCLNGRICPHRTRTADILKNWGPGILSYGNDIPLPSWAYASYRGTENDENFIRLAPVYSSASVNIITETQYDARPGIVTEKTIMAMIAGQVPIVIGHAGIVQDCREMGMDMFDDLVDTGYDTASNDVRVELALYTNEQLIRGKIDLDNYQTRLVAQRKWILDCFPDLMVRYFQQQVKQLV